MEVSQYIEELNRSVRRGNALEVGILLRDTDLLREYLKSMGVTPAILERYSCFEKIRAEMLNFAMKPDVEFGEKNVYADNGTSFIQASLISGGVISSDSNFLARRGCCKSLSIDKPNEEGNIVSKETIRGNDGEEQIVDTINKHGVVEKRVLRTPATVTEISRGEDENSFPILIQKETTTSEQTTTQPDYGYRNLTGIGFDNFGAQIIQDDEKFPGLLEWYETRFPGCTTEPERVVVAIKERIVSMLEAELAELIQAQTKYTNSNSTLRIGLRCMIDFLEGFTAEYEQAAVEAQKQEDVLKQSRSSLYRTAEESKAFVRIENTKISETLKSATEILKNKINEMDPTILTPDEESSQKTGNKITKSEEDAGKDAYESQTVEQKIDTLSKKIREAQPKTVLLKSENAMLKRAMQMIRGEIAKLPNLGITDRYKVMSEFNKMIDDRDL